ncbi:hypothetical protein [Desulfocurvus sp. DL9XJH121]
MRTELRMLELGTRPEAIKPEECGGGRAWTFFSSDVGGEHAGVAALGVAATGGDALLIIKPASLSPRVLRTFLAGIMPAFKDRARQAGAARIISVGGAEDTGFLKLTRAAGYESYVQIAAINLAEDGHVRR